MKIPKTNIFDDFFFQKLQLQHFSTEVFSYRKNLVSALTKFLR